VQLEKQQLMMIMMPFKRLWAARMLSMFTAQYPPILRSVAIIQVAMTLTTDTSEEVDSDSLAGPRTVTATY
jgi:hypothetical protein